MIKTIFSAALVLSIAPAGWAAAGPAPAEQKAPPAITVSVDPRVELMAVIFRLAGNKEYSEGKVPSYVRDVEEHFGPFKKHPAVELAAKLSRTRGVSYDAVMKMAVHMTDTVSLGERIPFSPQPATLDARWTTENAREFLALARKFVADSKFNEFFDQHQPLYQAAEQRLQAVLAEHARLDWFDGFFGPRPGADFRVIMGMLNGGGSYGARIALPDGREDLYSILGVWKLDEKGEPAFSAGMASTLVHELGHSYTNNVVDQFLKELKAPGEKLYELVAPQMREQAYGSWQTMMRESVLRACELRYAYAVAGTAAMKKTAEYESSRSFYWVGELGDVLARYDAQPRKYKDLAEFFPQIISFFNDYAHRAEAEIRAVKEADRKRKEERETKLKEWREKGPKIVSIIPADGSEVDPGLMAIVVKFDRAMAPGMSVMDIGPGKYPGTDGEGGYDADRKIFTMPLKLSAGTKYSFGLNHERYPGFKSEEGVPLFPAQVHFRTRAQDGAAAPEKP